MLGLLLLILAAGLFGYVSYLIALRIGKDSTIASIIGLIVFLLILFGGWGRADWLLSSVMDTGDVLAVNWNSRAGRP